MKNLLEINHLQTSYGTVKAVDDVSISVGEKEIVGIMGESGSGKSTLAYSVVRLVPPPGRITAGEIFLRGRNVLSLSNGEMRKLRGKEITMIFQDPSSFLNPVMKISDQISEVVVAHESDKAFNVSDRVIELLQSVRIPAPERVAESFPHQLSGGIKQRVMIAAAVANRPSLIIADEPTTALDTTVQRQIIQLLSDLVDETGSSLLLISHDPGVVAEICDRVYMMYAGKVVEERSTDSLFYEPRHPYTQELLKCVLSIEGLKESIYTIDGSVPNLLNPPSGCRFHPRCRHAMARCKEGDVPFVELGPNERVACWLYNPEVRASLPTSQAENF